ncbi:hypothetical protein QQG55_43700 [Brugia pahangi]
MLQCYDDVFLYVECMKKFILFSYTIKSFVPFQCFASHYELLKWKSCILGGSQNGVAGTGCICRDRQNERCSAQMHRMLRDVSSICIVAEVLRCNQYQIYHLVLFTM